MSEFALYLITGLGTGCAFALVGSGMIVIYRVTHVVNCAQGGFAVIGAMCASTFLGSGLPHGLAEGLAVVIAAAVGLTVGAITIGKPGTTPQVGFIITIGLGILAYAVEVLLWGDQPRSFDGVAGATVLFGARVPTHYLLIIAVTVLVFALLGLFFAGTYLGRALTACAANPYAARLVGIGVTRMGLFSFTLGGALGGLAGVLITPMQQVTFDGDVVLLVNGFAAAIIGMLTRPALALAGGLLLGVAQAAVAGYGSAAHQLEIALGLMLAVLIWQAARRPTVEGLP
ncbi:branched-chain amino acid ABC transporter permease [Plantactinospora soyae]|uniref:Branched-chain amino acid transport system permease protein n=1 Tax=Plantactinospora soyae TaxID=1544732 RepID=A0A927MBS2_9ACTN|nr:branched-chain amino acid ABC transporter permease [Plantactinospora soyae]MBE1491574.1 branched-chain amino acid transport system permease protein [Plantactinospora soyae]